MKRVGTFMLLLFILGSTASYGQEKKSKKQRREEQAAKIEQLVEAQDYVFIAQQTFPMSGKSINLTSGYDLQVNKEEISAYLPFFGRAYTAPMDPAQGGIKFKSNTFEYSVKPAKKEGWDIKIIPKDTQQRYELTLKITTSGSATLSVNDPSRQNISFNGYIDEQKKK
jgi:hypothetical protein